MKKITNCTGLIFIAAMCSLGCNKTSNNYSTTDHTVGITKLRSWSGTADGYNKGDTMISTSIGLRDTVWALHFARNIVDTSFSIAKINGFAISVLGTPLDYISTDSITTKTVVFDSNVSGTQTAILTYYYLQDSMTYQFNIVTGFNSSANQYYQVNMFLHTNHS